MQSVAFLKLDGLMKFTEIFIGGTSLLHVYRIHSNIHRRKFMFFLLITIFVHNPFI